MTARGYTARQVFMLKSQAVAFDFQFIWLSRSRMKVKMYADGVGPFFYSEYKLNVFITSL